MTHSDINSSPQKLSKIETLRLARNYISAMSQTLHEGRSMDLVRFIKILSQELSQTTANLLQGTLMQTMNPSPYCNNFDQDSFVEAETYFNKYGYFNNCENETRHFCCTNYCNNRLSGYGILYGRHRNYDNYFGAGSDNYRAPNYNNANNLCFRSFSGFSTNSL